MRQRLLASSMICGAAMLGLSATQAAAQQANEEVSEIVVTGSRIPQPNLTSVSPLSVVSNQEVKLQGATSIETVLQNLPSVVPEFNQGVDNGATGTATVSLRGLGSNRTLVLVNGNRLMPGDPIVPSPDLNNIPAALVERVEVVTGGASAVYGSDAVAGVVNFILTKDFEGVRVDATYGGALHDNNNDYLRGLLRDYNAAHPGNEIALPGNKFDARSYDATLVVGVNAPDGKGNVTAYASYRRILPLSQGRRDYGACGISTVPSTTSVYDTQICQGSGNSAYGRFVDFGTANNPNGSNTFVPYTGAFAFNFGPFNYYQQDDERYTAGYFAHYEISPQFDIYSDLMFADDHQLTQAAPSGLFFNNGPVHSINCANPYMSAQQAAVICGPDATVVNGVSTGLSIAYRLAGVPRLTQLDHTAYTIGLGSRGALGEDWTYDLRLQYGKTSFRNIFTGDVSIRKINDALNAVAGPGGVPVCASGNTGCVPLNIFRAQSAGITQSQLDYILDSGFKNGTTIEQVATLNIAGKLPEEFKSPWAKDQIGIAVGSEYRREQLDLQVSSNFGTADLSGNGGINPPASGEFDVYELYGEARIPIVQEAPFADDLSLELGIRYADYNPQGSATAYKVAGDWAITPDVRVRGGYNRAVRAPNIVELFAPQVVALASYDDPCSGAAPASGCARTFSSAAAAAQFLGRVPDCAAAQCSELQGGNTDLTPEKADTYTIGAVFTPKFLPGFNGSVDWYNIKIKNPIVPGIGGALILSQCIQNGQFCDRIHRSPQTGSLFGLTQNDGYVINVNANSGSIETAGLDVAANYRQEIGDYGSLALQFIGSYVDKFVTEPVKGLGKYDCSGYFGLVCLQPVPEWKHQARLTWTTPWYGIQTSLNWRYIGKVKLDLNTDDPFLAAFGPDFENSADAKIKAYNYFDLAVNWKVRDVSFRVGMNNIFDKDPPVVDANNIGIAGTSAFGNGNTYPGVYDTLGRTVFVGVTADF